MAIVVVGVDRSEGAVAALRFACEEARLRGATLRIVHAWSLSPGVIGGAPYFAIGPLPELERGLAEEADAVIGDLLEQVGADAEGLTVEQRVELGPPGSLLVREAEGADLLVVGSRGHGGFTGLLLGSVSRHCLHHAPCPVAVVRAVPEG
jgi:nucleotide-binding universal stress UspA family protein